MKTTVITSKESLLPHREDILALFTASYGSALDAAVWTWAYLDNPAGEPVVALCHDEGRLVGHYAVIPMPVARAGARLEACLSMTTMVAPTHQGRGLFVSLARAAYDAASARGVACVLGFPNPNSAPGFRKHLGWQLPVPDRIATFEKSSLLAFADAHRPFSADRYGIDLADARLRRWRLAKPGVAYRELEGLVVKDFGDAVDLVWCAHERHLHALPGDRPINVLVEGGVALPAGVTASDYQFGAASLAQPVAAAQFQRCMLLSDVF